MIIKVDNATNGKQYEKLFKDAYELLVDAGKITESNGAGKFTNLEEFFSHIADIYNADNSFLIKLPVDEPALAIDANRRTIDTTLFNRTANVQSDEVAEIAVFSIDRYFDYMDLATTEIWVQWTAPGEDGTLREGATLIELKDLETEPGKLRFGWPLGSEITAVPGNVQFAVRFFKRGTVVLEADKDGNPVKEENKIIYSFNTLPANLRISNALQPELNPSDEQHKPHSLFVYAITNSLYNGKDVIVPQTPSFAAPGLDLPITATLNENDTLTLKAQAVVGDLGTVHYTWYFTSAVGDGVPKLADEVADEKGNKLGTSGIMFSEIDSTREILSEDYWVEAAEDATFAPTELYEQVDGIAYVPYYGNFPAIDENGNPIKLYEKFTTFTIAPLTETSGVADVTGVYQVRAVNETTIKGMHRDSGECTLVSPSDIIISENLPAKAIMVAAEEGVEPSIELKLLVNRIENDNSAYSYCWKNGLTPNKDALTGDEFVDSNVLEVKTPGYYSADIKSHLNRQTKMDTEHVNVTKVTFMPEKPEFEVDLDTYKATIEANYYETDSLIPIDGDVVLAFDATVENAGDDADLYDKDNLYSEGLTYSWFVTTPDETPKALTKDDIVAGSVYSNSITIAKTVKGILYTCEVTNTLNDNIAVEKIVFDIR